MFERDNDWKILKNDWPYGIDARIAHLVVWTKFVLKNDPTTEDLTDEARSAIQCFVDDKFGAVGKDNVSIFCKTQGEYGADA